MEEQKKGEVMAAFNRSLDVGLAKHAKEAAGEEQKEDGAEQSTAAVWAMVRPGRVTRPCS